MKKEIMLIILVFWAMFTQAQIKILFDATKAETASNADWIIDADEFNLDYDPDPVLGGNEANPQRFPTPDQSTVDSETSEDYWTGANSSWGIESVKAGFQVETLPYDAKITYGDATNPQDLSNYKVYIVTEPNIMFTDSEKTAILEFVKNGGGLFITADHNVSDRNGDGVDSVDVWNDLFKNNDLDYNPFGFLFDYENFTEDTTNTAPDSDDPVLDGPYGKPDDLEFYGGTSMTLYPDVNKNVVGIFYRMGADPYNKWAAMVARSTYGLGRVVAMGDSSPADDGTGDTGDHLYDGWDEDADGDHRILIMNATIWLAGGDTTGVALYNESVKFRVYVRDNRFYMTATDIKVNSIGIYNTLGQKVLKFNSANLTAGMPLTLPKGVYIAVATADNGQRYQTKFLVR